MGRRHNLIFSVFILAALCCTWGCADELADRYADPDNNIEPTIDKLLTEMLDNDRVRPAYWEMSTFINWHIGIYTQSVGFLNSESVYQQNDSYIQDRWDDFYSPGVNGGGVMAHYREMEKLFTSLSENERKEQEVFMYAARVFLYDMTSQMVDLWGDIPYSEAGLLNKTGEAIFPAFDKSEDVYNEILMGLEQANFYFGTARLSSEVQSAFSKQDILLSGSIDQWRRYANSIRLRLLMRISMSNESRASAEVMEMLANPLFYPLVGDGEVYFPPGQDVLLFPLTNYTNDLRSAFLDWVNYPAPYHMLEKVMKPTNDPRTDVLFDKYGVLSNGAFSPNTAFNAIPLDLPRIEQERLLGSHAIVDSSTFLYNSKLPGILITVPEVEFLKAEAHERWGSTVEAAAFYRSAVSNSITFYFYLNSLNNRPRNPLIPPSENEVEDFLATSDMVRYEGDQVQKLEKIWTQKWLHFGFMQAVQSWAEMRRTNYPKLQFRPSSLSGFELPPRRLTYPPDEKSLNPNYWQISSQDTRNNPVFWDVD